MDKSENANKNIQATAASTSFSRHTFDELHVSAGHMSSHDGVTWERNEPNDP